MDNTENTQEYVLQMTFDDEASWEEFRDVCKARDLFLDIDVISEDEDGQVINFFGTQEELIQFAEIDHILHGAGFAFNPQEVIEVMEPAD